MILQVIQHAAAAAVPVLLGAVIGHLPLFLMPPEVLSLFLAPFVYNFFGLAPGMGGGRCESLVLLDLDLVGTVFLLLSVALHFALDAGSVVFAVESGQYDLFLGVCPLFHLLAVFFLLGPDELLV